MAIAESAWPRIIAHADMDAFYAAIEQMDDPSLRGRPVLVGPRSGRGVVLTASYEARPFKVGSAMPMARAIRMCPDAIVVPPRFQRYTEISRIVMQVFSAFSPHVEALSLDEAFLDLTGTGPLLGDPRTIGMNLKAAVREATGGLTVSVGISATKYVAKVASDCQKPDGLTIVGPDEAQAWLAPFPVSRLWGAGPETEKRLQALGLHTIRDVAACDPDWLKQQLGSSGRRFHSLAHAQDPRPVAGRHSSKSIGSERTLEKDISDKLQIKRYLRRSAEEIARRLRRKHHLAFGVQVKLKTAEFQTLTRQHRRHQPTDVAEELFDDACLMLGKLNHPGPFRLVGMSAYHLIAADKSAQGDLFDSAVRRRRLETAVDALTERFGPNVLRRADDLSRARQTPNLDFIGEADDADDV